MTFVVYEVWDLVKNVPIYVGKAADVKAREAQHLKYMKKVRNGPAFHKILRRMIADGQSHEYRVVFETASEQEAFGEERRRIALHGRRDLGTGSLWNLTDGGEGMSGWRAPEEVRQRWSAMRKGQTPPNKGKTYSHRVVSPKKDKTWSAAQRAEFESRTPEKRAETAAKRRAKLLGRPQDPELSRQHSERMKGAGNPMFGKTGSWAGKVGPWAGKTHPNKGRKKGPDGKLYHPDQLREEFGIG